MGNNLDLLIEKLKIQADSIDELNQRSVLRYKSTQRLVLEYGQPFTKKVKSPFKGEPRSCFQNCYQALWKYPQLNYCEGFATDDEIDIIVSHAWLINDNQEVIDPTWVGKEHKSSVYFGVVFNREYVMEMAEKTKRYGIIDSHYMNNHQLMREGFSPHALRQL